MGKEYGRSLGMPVDEFINQTYPQLEQGIEHISVGIPGGVTAEDYHSFVATRQKMFDGLSDMIMKNMNL